MGQTAMIVLKIMPGSVELDLKELAARVSAAIKKVYGDVGEIQVKEEPVAFGLRALLFTFIMEEAMGSDPIEAALEGMEGVASAQVLEFRRTVG